MITLESLNANHPLWNEISELYIQTFPVNERRDPDELVNIQGSEGYWLELIKFNEDWAGFIEYWDFKEFLFIEHLAIVPQKRNNGLGQAVLLQFISGNFKPVLLEAEIPLDEISHRRIKFYERCGFKPVNVDYTQPPYYPGKASVPLLLLSNLPVQTAIANSFIRIISRNVYQTD